MKKTIKDLSKLTITLTKKHSQKVKGGDYIGVIDVDTG